MKCRFILPSDTLGMRNDIATYSEWFPDHEVTLPGDAVQKRVDINFYLERPQMRAIGLARINVVMCNYEFLLFEPFAAETLRALPQIDYIICKTRVAEKYCEELKRERGFRYTTVYTRHTTRVEAGPETTDWENWVHVGGTSPYKNTDVVIKIWRRHPEWPRLYFVCTGPCAKNLDRYLPDWREDRANICNLGYQERLSLLQHRVFNHICPSMVEGYGHYINEARAYGRFILTTDGAPMNELVTAQSGILTPCRMVPKRSSPGIWSCTLREDELERDILRAIATPLARRRVMARAAHRRFQEDTRYFRRAMAAFLRELKKRISR